jgi:sorbitol-specific phosphotransferase system component IIA
LVVTAVGPVANENFINLGHLVLKLDSATEAALPGDVSCSFTYKPEIKVEDRIEII